MKKYYLITFTILLSILGNAQSVGIGTSTPNTKAELEISSSTKGVLLPRMTTAARNSITTPPKGLIVNDTSINGLFYYSGSSWQNLAAGGSSQWNNNGDNIHNSNIGNVCIGGTTPTRKLEIQNGDFRIQRNVSGSRFFEFFSAVAGQNDVRFEHSSSGSYLYISGSTNDFSSFNDKLRIDLGATPTYVMTVYGSALASGGTWAASDKKLKKDIKEIENASAVIKAMKPKSYFFKKEDYGNLNLPATIQYGLLAQDVESVLPALVRTTEEAVRVEASGKREMEEIKSVNYPALVPILIKALQELQQEVDELKTKLAEISKAK